MTIEAEEPSPPATVIIGGLLRLIAAGLEPLEVEPIRPDATISVDTASGWWLLLRLGQQGEPLELTYAQPPSRLVPPWSYGCQRDDWTLGPESRVVTPLELLTAEQWQRLWEVLKGAPVRWTWAPLIGWDVSNLDEELMLD